MKQTRRLVIYNFDRRRQVQIGGGAPVSIQSMTNTRTGDAAATIKQIRELAQAGCEIIRLAIPDEAAAAALKEILPESPSPVIGDIHFDYRLALAAIKNGIAGIRINPGNIGGEERVRRVAEAAGEAGIVLRVGANAGSINPERLAQLRNDKNFLAAKAQEAKLANRQFDPLEEAVLHLLCQSVLEQCALLQKYDFHNIKVSLKSSSIPLTIKACRAFARLSDFPQHIGITESGTLRRGLIKSCVGIGALLAEGIGDTLRVSLTAAPLEEVKTARAILEALELRKAEPELVSCPTCGRTSIDLIALATRVEDFVDGLKASGREIKLRKIAVMGCVVNGPGEARDADLGIAGGGGKLMLFRHGEIVATYTEREGFAELCHLIEEAADK